MSPWDASSHCRVKTSITSLCDPFLILLNRGAKTASDVDFLVGFETEFMLLKSINPIEPVSIHAWTTADSLRSGSIATAVLADMVHAIELSGIEVQIYHGEAGPGQVCYDYLHK